MPHIDILCIRHPRGKLETIDGRGTLPAAINRCQELYRDHPLWHLYTRAVAGSPQLVMRLHAG